MTAEQIVSVLNAVGTVFAAASAFAALWKVNKMDVKVNGQLASLIALATNKGKAEGRAEEKADEAARDAADETTKEQ